MQIPCFLDINRKLVSSLAIVQQHNKKAGKQLLVIYFQHIYSKDRNESHSISVLIIFDEEDTIREFKVQRPNSNENIAQKVNLRSFSLYSDYSYPLCQMWANPPEAEFQETISSLRKRNKISSLLVYVLHKTRNQAFSPRIRAKTGKKCTKKCEARAKLLFCLIKPIVFSDILVAVAQLNLKVNRKR